MGLRGLYAITDGSHGDTLLASVTAVLRGGAALVQYRDKSVDGPRRHDEALALVALCRAHDVPLIVNDDIELAGAVAADGVHIGRDDGSVARARSQLGSSALIGVSCYADLDLARSAAAAGADYVAFGSVFPSPTKPHAVRAAPELIGAAKRELGLPVCTIGGIQADNAAILVEAGADMLAVISALFAAPDPEQAARRIAQHFLPGT